MNAVWHAWVASPKVLRQSVSDFVIVTFFRDKDVHRQGSVRRRIEDAHGDGGPILVDRIPKQCRSAIATKATPHLLRRMVPSDGVLTFNMQCRSGDINRGFVMAGGLATCSTVAGCRTRQVTFDCDAHIAAKAGSSKHRVFQSPASVVCHVAYPVPRSEPSRRRAVSARYVDSLCRLCGAKEARRKSSSGAALRDR